MTIFVQEFLYRGYEPSKGGGGAWHVVLGSEVADGFGGTVVQLQTMSIAQAEAAGHALPDLIGSINAATLAAAEGLAADLQAAQEAKASAEAQVVELMTQLAALQTDEAAHAAG